MKEYTIRRIAAISSEFPSKFGIPRQSGLAANAKGIIVFEPKFRNPDAVKGIEEFSHLKDIGKRVNALEVEKE